MKVTSASEPVDWTPEGYYRRVADRMPPGTVVSPTAPSTFQHDRFDYAPPARSAPSRLSWLIGVVVSAATVAALDWTTARWETTASFALGFPGGPRIDVREKRGPSGLLYSRRAQASTGRQERSL